MSLCPGWWLDMVPLSLRSREKDCMVQIEDAQNPKDTTMPVINSLLVRGNGYKTAWGRDMDETFQETCAALHHFHCSIIQRFMGFIWLSLFSLLKTVTG